MIDDSCDRRLGHERIAQVFQFLKALNEHRNPAQRKIGNQPWMMWLDDLPDHESIQIGSQRAGVTALQEGEADGAPDQITDILRVRRPRLTNPPSPPEIIRPWLRNGWDEPSNPAEFVESRNESDDRSGQTLIARFDDDPSRPEAFHCWQLLHDDWRANELPARRAMKVFSELYELYGRIDRDSERLDLVLGDGILSWQQEDESLYHPILIQRVQLLFDPNIPEFAVVNSDFGVELYTSLFQCVADADGQSLARCRDELAKSPCHPLAGEADAFLKRFVVALSPQGDFCGRGRPRPNPKQPTIGRSAVLFLRPRTQGFGNAIQQVLDTVHERAEFCSGLLNIVGVETSLASQHDAEETASSLRQSRSCPDILFVREANLEQRQIAERLDEHGAVLVQGPPGTGKSHTIANLIGHLLANGHKVLVTSHTTKALRVLRNHVVPALRPLCVSVLESDLESRKQLEESVLEIGSRLSASDAQTLERDAERLAKRRMQILERMARLKTDVLNARTNEYRDVVLAGKARSPASAARQVAARKGFHDWIPGPIAAGYPMPLSHSELFDLYATNSTTSPDDDLHVDAAFPDPASVPKPEVFSELVTLIAEGSQEATDSFDELWSTMELGDPIIDLLDQLIQRWRQASQALLQKASWQLAAVNAGRQSQSDRAPWEYLLAKIDEASRLASDFRLDFVQLAPELASDMELDEQSRHLAGIRRHLAAGRRLNWAVLARRPAWKRAIRAWRVRGQEPKESAHFGALDRCLRLTVARGELAILWDGLMAEHGISRFEQLGADPESECSQYSGAIGEALGWWNRVWNPLVDEAQKLGFNWQRFVERLPASSGEHAAILRIVRAVDAELSPRLATMLRRLRAQNAQQRLKDIAAALPRDGWREPCRLRLAIEQYDAEAYQNAHDDLLAAARRRRDVIHRHQLLRRLERTPDGGLPLAEAWASAVRKRAGVHCEGELPGDPTLAWEWRQLCEELDRRSQTDVEILYSDLETLHHELETCTEELVDCRAWSRQIRRTSLAQRKALIGWLDAVRKIGKGYSKRAAELRAAARMQMSACCDAVPVWIMPLARLVETFDFAKTQFDVVIIDEASQCDVMALLALAAARKVVVVGDHEQVSPLAVGQNVEAVQKLIATHLSGVPNRHLYDGQLSVYDLARQSFGGMICLLEHFRCLPDIIQFSNYLSYNGKIKPLRDATGIRLSPQVVPYRVEATARDEKRNPEEALAVASLIAAMLETSEYAGKTIGAISLVGDEQALEIERLLLKHIRPEEFRARRMLCGNSAQFQGDERDVMLLSLVDTPKDGPLALRQQPMFQQRFNVAASRARDQMWVVYSLSPETDLKPGDLRRRLIEHAIDPRAVAREVRIAAERVESEFERQVMERLVQRRFRVTPRWSVGHYRIDLVVEGGGKRLAVECDGDRYHPIEKLEEDMARQATLERLGWKFARIRGSQFFRDPDEAMQSVFLKLEELGIPPDASPGAVEGDHRGSEVVSAIIRRAAEIRSEWRLADEGSPLQNGLARGAAIEGLGRKRNAAISSQRSLFDRPDATGSSQNALDGPEVEQATLAAAPLPVEIWQMTREEFHKYKRSLSATQQVDAQAINREYWEAIGLAVAEGKEVAAPTSREWQFIKQANNRQP